MATLQQSFPNIREGGSSAYQRYIASLCRRNPSLQNLQYFLQTRHTYGLNCRSCVFDFNENVRIPTCRHLDDIQLMNLELRPESSTRGVERGNGIENEQPIQGRIVVIEDLTPAIVMLLGSELDIDPLFFAMHLHTAQRAGMRQQTPQEATLPSRFASTNYINATFHQSVQHNDETPAGGRLLRNTIIDRKLVFLPHTKIALAQYCVSVLKVEISKNSWLAIILVDPPIKDEYWVDGQKGVKGCEVGFVTQPYLGAFEDFLAPPPFSETQSDQFEHARSGMLEDMKHYWGRELPPSFDPNNPSLLSLAFFPLKIAASEWLKYGTVMHNCIKQYEYQSDKLPDLAKFDTNLYELQSWRRRSMYSQQKIRSIISFLESRRSSGAKGEEDYIASLLGDYEFVARGIQEAGQRLENMLPVVTSLVAIADARHSFAETANISRLTVLALIFVPLNFVSSLFSMNPENAPGSKHFWVYFVVAIPVTIGVLFIARPVHKDFVGLWRLVIRKMARNQQDTPEFSLTRVLTKASEMPLKEV